MREFRAGLEQEHDVVGFDVICGDLNMHHGCEGPAPPEQQELFQHYIDPCRVGQQRDAPWAMGTLLDYLKIYDDPINSPDRMKRTLSDPVGRRRSWRDPSSATPNVTPKGRHDPNRDFNRDPNMDPNRDPNMDPNGAPLPAEWQGRRVDYILYREGDSRMSTTVSSLCFVTALAARSDHLPTALTLSVRPTSGGG
ncbi:sphingomyelin phosphodiesterase 3-like, partial [Coturnix japonica]